MATNQERTEAICGALANGPVTLAQIDKLARALYDEDAFGAPYDELTAGARWAIVPAYFRRVAIGALTVAAREEAARTVPAVDFGEG